MLGCWEGRGGFDPVFLKERPALVCWLDQGPATRVALRKGPQPCGCLQRAHPLCPLGALRRGRARARAPLLCPPARTQPRPGVQVVLAQNRLFTPLNSQRKTQLPFSPHPSVHLKFCVANFCFWRSGFPLPPSQPHLVRKQPPPLPTPPSPAPKQKGREGAGVGVGGGSAVWGSLSLSPG